MTVNALRDRFFKNSYWFALGMLGGQFCAEPTKWNAAWFIGFLLCSPLAWEKRRQYFYETEYP